MSVAWTTILIVALLLPGVFFFIGVATYERLSREIIRSGVVSEVGMAIMVALVLHALAFAILQYSDFDIVAFFEPLSNYSRLSSHVLIGRIADRLVPALSYVICTAGLGFVCGALVAKGIVSGPLRFLATHKWIYDIIDADKKGGIVTAFVMTTTVENNHALMYRGRVKELYLAPEGALAYVILRNCARFYMSFEGSAPETGEQLNLFGKKQDSRPTQMWDYLMIEGSHIANILFDSTPEIRATNEGNVALKKAVDETLKLEEANAQAALRSIAERRTGAVPAAGP